MILKINIGFGKEVNALNTNESKEITIVFNFRLKFPGRKYRSMLE